MKMKRATLGISLINVTTPSGMPKNIAHAFAGAQRDNDCFNSLKPGMHSIRAPKMPQRHLNNDSKNKFKASEINTNDSFET